MTDRVWIVRHASTDWTGRRWCGRTDLPLSTVGRSQAIELAIALGSRLPDSAIIVSSPARRAIETAEAIASPASLPVEILDDLREVDFGTAEGQTWTELERTQPTLARLLVAGATDIDWPAGEAAADVHDRAASIWRLISGAQRPLVLVTHGGLGRALLGQMPGPDPPRARHLGAAEAIELAWADNGWTASSPLGVR
jgi:broad specificity phosphatase PhoE